MVASTLGRTPTQNVCPAKQLGPDQRRQISVAVLAGVGNVSQTAADCGVSRNFCYKLATQGKAALDQTFNPVEPDEKVLFYLPVTQSWIT